MEEQEEKAFMVAKNFTCMMDNRESWSFHDLSEDSILDWFGRSVLGREQIISFIRTHLPSTHHTIDSITLIPPVSHRFLKRAAGSVSNPQQNSSKPVVVECGQGDCRGKSTPENVIRPNLVELAKAPRRRRCAATYDTSWQFLEIKGKLELEPTLKDGSYHHVSEKKIQRIVLGYTDQIHLIVYEGRYLCKKKLLPLFNVADE